jgi:hypothetical protein
MIITGPVRQTRMRTSPVSLLDQFANCKERRSVTESLGRGASRRYDKAFPEHSPHPTDVQARGVQWVATGRAANSRHKRHVRERTGIAFRADANILYILHSGEKWRRSQHKKRCLFWDKTPYTLLKFNRSFGWIFRLHLVTIQTR